MAVKFYLFKKHDVISYLQYVCVNIFRRFHPLGNILFSVVIFYYSYYQEKSNLYVIPYYKKKRIKDSFFYNSIIFTIAF